MNTITKYLLSIAIALFLFFNPTFLTAQNVGIGNTNPEKKLHVSGDIQSDSTLLARALQVNSAVGNKAIIADSDSAFIQLWSNDTLWYQLSVNSPPEEQFISGNQKIERGFDEEKGYYFAAYDSLGNLIDKKFNYFDKNNQYLFHDEFYENGCLKREEKFYPNLSKKLKIVYDCPSGDTCYTEEKIIGASPLFLGDTIKRVFYKEVFEYYHGDLMGKDADSNKFVMKFMDLDIDAVPKAHAHEKMTEHNIELEWGLEDSKTIWEVDTVRVKIEYVKFNETDSDTTGILLDTSGIGFYRPGKSDWFVKLNDSTQYFGFPFGTDTIYADHRPAERTLEYGATEPESPTAPPFEFNVDGLINKSGGSFRIDHPLDPDNMYLYHSFVESPDMMNVYNGNVITNSEGWARVDLPTYFQALNADFRYQLTTIGSFAQAMISKKISSNYFEIRTSEPNVEVSWQVTGIRIDDFAKDHRIKVEREKVGRMKGKRIYNTKN